MSNRDRAIIAQTSAKVAGELCHGKGEAGLNEYLACSEMVFNDILEHAGEVGDATPPAAVAPAVQGIPAPPVMAAAAPPAAQVQAAFPGAAIVAAPGGDVIAPAAMTFPAPAAAKPASGARKKMQLDGNGFVTDGRQAAWNVAFLCAGQKTDDGKVVVFDNKRKKESGEWKANAADFNISEVGATLYGLGAKRIGLWLSDAPTNIQAGDGSILPFNVADMHARCGG
jgi:hypothetical protein|tara:strand:+ start:884 stop:1561 length:678 start_codon:yes stop_codon:yes gene_type:complete